VRIEILTLFPEFFTSPLAASIVGQAREKGLISVAPRDIRDYAKGRHRVTDEPPYGGGPGMVMKPEPIFGAVEAARAAAGPGGARVILMTPQGSPFSQAKAKELSFLPAIILLCGRYEGIDERVRTSLVDEELSIGDYVLIGGEAAALVVVEAVVRHLPGVLGKAESLEEETFSSGLLEYPQYTRPPEFRGLAVPEILLSGDHGAIRAWRRRKALLRTLARRPDLLDGAELTVAERRWLDKVASGEETAE
jgi:tRNA (guanine37-N1)-methyltransferase